MFGQTELVQKLDKQLKYVAKKSKEAARWKRFQNIRRDRVLDEGGPPILGKIVWPYWNWQRIHTYPWVPFRRYFERTERQSPQIELFGSDKNVMVQREICEDDI